MPRPRQGGGEGRQDEREGIACLGWWSALPLTTWQRGRGGQDGWQNVRQGTDGRKREAAGWQTAPAGLLPLLFAGEVVAITSPRAGAGCPLFPLYLGAGAIG